ncbi:hypothetical protein GCM10010507_44600 [Streptomyces cinnamoneus]|uniref:Uncharacterized protein n=1 Tax=Streptomyces cinnamoneus TaxID=53446 RepID=A0A918WPN4_STRCJ|nr:hypothetical protein GCM10010507_44600 [Streptomyces cinnamoneus]
MLAFGDLQEFRCLAFRLPLLDPRRVSATVRRSERLVRVAHHPPPDVSPTVSPNRFVVLVEEEQSSLTPARLTRVRTVLDFRLDDRIPLEVRRKSVNG